MREADDEVGDAPDRPGTDKSVDESWKERARLEKDRLEEAPEPSGDRELPEASFLGLVEELSLRTVFALGQMPNPLTGEQELDLPAAKYTIDLLGTLEEKTMGNLSEEEAAVLTELLQRLRMSYVYYAQHGPAEAVSEDGGDGEPSGPRIIV